MLGAAREAGFDDVELEALRRQGDIALSAGRTAAAAAAYETALDRAREVGHTGEQILAATALADLRLEAGDDLAAAELMKFLENQPPSGPLLKLQARYVSGQGDMASAAELMARARDLSGARWTEQDEALLHRYQRP